MPIMRATPAMVIFLSRRIRLILCPTIKSCSGQWSFLKAMLHTIEFWLPFPPSTNRLWRSVRGRVIRNPECVSWHRQAENDILYTQHLGNGPVIGAHDFEMQL